MTTGPGWFVRQMWWRLPRRHPSEDRLLALALGTMGVAGMDVTVMSHLRVCGPCEHRFTALKTLLTAMPEVADDQFEEVFTPQRLQSQRARIGHRLAQLVGTVEPARVLAFPIYARTLRRFDLHPASWLAVAAAIGVLLGVTAGQLVHYYPFVTQSTPVADPADTAARSAAALDGSAGTFDVTGTIELPPTDGNNPTQASSLTLAEFAQLMAEEGFLSNLDLALTSHQISELESIDALTPRVRDLSINLR